MEQPREDRETTVDEHREPTVTVAEILKTAGAVAGAGVAATVGGAVALSATGCRCGSDDFDYEAWAETDGAAGRINMQAVQQALEEASDPSDFEDRINRIYEGENPVLIKVYNAGQNQNVEGWEDLDGNGEITDAEDDKLFTLTRNGQGEAQLRGHGANSYYNHHYPHHHSPMGGFWTGFLVARFMMPGWGGYATPMGRRSVIINNTRSYRQSGGYRAQRNANRSFYAGQRATNPNFAKAGRSASPARQSFRNGVRGSGGKFRSSGGLGRSGGFRGGGR